MARLREDYSTKVPALARFTGYYMSDANAAELTHLVKALQTTEEIALLHYDGEVGLVGLYTVPKHSVC